MQDQTAHPKKRSLYYAGVNNTVDLAMTGPMPLEIRRNYSSQNQANNQFGYCWKLNYMPYLVLTTNQASLLTVIYEAEPDGSVIAFRQMTNNSTSFKPIASDNPELNNFSSEGIGTCANLFNSSITNFNVGTNQFYELIGADGSMRTFQVQSYPISNATNTIYRQRPYLSKWQDAQGNYYLFSYGTDGTQADYGQVRRIQSSNGNFIGFYYDEYQHIIEAYAGDGRILYYGYDAHGDLISVTLPDASQIQYVYQNITTSSNTYSTHLISQEIKPDGRILENIFDNTNRVIAQLATVGLDLNLYTNAQFVYSNNFYS
jgi:YD repeat-containing protein